MSKQDRQGVRTPADLEQKYQFGKKFAELMGIATDARESVDSLASTLRSEMREQETSIIRDTEKIMLTALENYVKTDEMAEVEQILRGELLVMSNRITASVTDYTTKITAAEKEITDLRGELTVKADEISAVVSENTRKITEAEGEITRVEEDLTGALIVQAERITASITTSANQYNEVKDSVSTLKEDTESELEVLSGRITASVNTSTSQYNEVKGSVNTLSSNTSTQLQLLDNKITNSVTDYTNKFAKVGEDIAESESKLRSEITTKADGISMTVDQHTEQIKKNNETVTGVTDKLRADLDLTAQDMTLGFQGVSERFDGVEGGLQTVTEELAKYFVFDTNGLTIKAGENDMQLRLDNGIISFRKNGQQFGWWDGVNFHTGSIVVELNQQARFGDFAFVPRSNGSLDFLKVGG